MGWEKKGEGGDLGVTACPGFSETCQDFILAAARGRWTPLPKMRALRELTQQRDSGTRCLRAPLRTQMTSDEVCLFSDKVQRFRESSDQLRFTDENVEGQRSETRLASKK